MGAFKPAVRCFGILAKKARTGKWHYCHFSTTWLWLFHHFKTKTNKMAASLKDLMRGDVPLARAIFDDERKRRLIPQLQKEGWPIFDFAGKRSAFPTDLNAAKARVRKASRERAAQRKTSAGRL